MLLSKNRLFIRKEPSRDAKSLYIFCEGKKRENQYFFYFKEIDSRINIEIYSLKHDENNSPTGLYNIACKSLIKSADNPNPKYEFIDKTDEVWFIIDTDEWGNKIKELREKCDIHNNWFVAQSNPCFEVWLWYHLNEKKPKIKEINKCKNWKIHLDQKINGGFNSKKHPIYLEDAIENSMKTFQEENELPKVGCTEVFKTGNSILPLIKEKLNTALKIKL